MNFYDIAYGLGVAVASPVWMLKGKARRKVLRAFGERMGQGIELRQGTGEAVLIHAVSLGEMNATRSLVQGLSERRGDLEFIITSTTDTGFARGREIYGTNPKVRVVKYPLDFSAGIERLLEATRPSLVVLMELEVWPNFLRKCEERGIPVVLVNGRLTWSSYRNYRWGKWVTGGMFKRLAVVCAQDETYARRFVEVGAKLERVRITGTMKFDNAQIADSVPGDKALAAEVGLDSSETVWVCGSTGPGEEKLVLEQYGALKEKYKGLRLVIVPRHPARFDEVAEMIRGFGFGLARRSEKKVAKGDEVILGDTMGELKKFYALGRVVFVGRTLVDLGPRQHGSDMIEPAALGKPVVVGRYTGNFAEAMERFLAARAMVVVGNGQELGEMVGRLLSNEAESRVMGERARRVVKQEQGATGRHVEVVLEMLEKKVRGQVKRV